MVAAGVVQATPAAQEIPAVLVGRAEQVTPEIQELPLATAHLIAYPLSAAVLIQLMFRLMVKLLFLGIRNEKSSHKSS